MSLTMITSGMDMGRNDRTLLDIGAHMAVLGLAKLPWALVVYVMRLRTLISIANGQMP